MTAISSQSDHHITKSQGVGSLMVAAVGIVFGDIGTSPLYAIHETFVGPHPLSIDRFNILGVLSLIFWSLIIVVSLKYVIVMMRADNRGEGGCLALQALVGQAAADKPKLAKRVAQLGIFAAALFYGDSMITPAVSVLSAVEGVGVVAPEFTRYILPATLGILLVLFMIQRQGSAAVGSMFGPVMLIWFVVIGILGVRNIAHAPEVLAALSPHHAFAFLLHGGLTGFMALGSVVLAVTGCEALYADMGHFGRIPIRLAWYLLVLPALILNYFGQGALLLINPKAIENPFFLMAPAWAGIPLVGLATIATVIASQAVISGAFSMTRQAIQLGYLPRMEIVHTSESEIGQIYIPFINWILAVAVAVLVIGFGTSSNLAAAYGVAVTGTMFISTILLSMVMTLLWGWKGRRTAALVGMFLLVDGTFFLANATKIPYGGWFPLAVAAVVYVLLITWKMGRTLLIERLRQETMPVDDFLGSISDRIPRVPGTAIFLTATSEGVPLSLLHNLKHNKILHERVIICSVIMEDLPYIPVERRLESIPLGPNFHRLILRYGFMRDPNIPKALAQARTDELGFFYEPMSISYFLTRETLIPSTRHALPVWREQLFIAMARSAASTMDFFHLPINRVVELGSQVEL